MHNVLIFKLYTKLNANFPVS